MVGQRLPIVRQMIALLAVAGCSCRLVSLYTNSDAGVPLTRYVMV